MTARPSSWRLRARWRVARGPVGVGAQDHFGVEDISEILAKALNEAPAATGASEPAH